MKSWLAIKWRSWTFQLKVMVMLPTQVLTAQQLEDSLTKSVHCFVLKPHFIMHSISRHNGNVYFAKRQMLQWDCSVWFSVHLHWRRACYFERRWLCWCQRNKHQNQHKSRSLNVLVRHAIIFVQSNRRMGGISLEGPGPAWKCHLE